MQVSRYPPSCILHDPLIPFRSPILKAHGRPSNAHSWGGHCCDYSKKGALAALTARDVVRNCMQGICVACSEYQNGRPSVFRHPFSGTGNKIVTAERLQGGSSTQWGRGCGERRRGENYRLPSLQGNNSVECRDAPDSELSRKMFRDVVPPGRTGKSMHNGDSTKVKEDLGNACWFCEGVRRMFIPSPTKVKLPCVLIMIRIPVWRSSLVMVIKVFTRGVPSARYCQRSHINKR